MVPSDDASPLPESVLTGPLRLRGRRRRSDRGSEDPGAALRGDDYAHPHPHGAGQDVPARGRVWVEPGRHAAEFGDVDEHPTDRAHGCVSSMSCGSRKQAAAVGV